MKNRFFFFLAAAFALGACSGPATLTVEVTNPSAVEREAATVEIAWEQVAALSGLTPENVIVCNGAGEEIPSQVLYYGENEPQSIIFQTDVDAQQTATFTIATGVRADYPARAFGRQVPARYDD